MATPTYNPDYREMPTYSAPQWDTGAIDALTQKRAAPGLRAMRNQVNRASGVSYDNPNMKRMTLRDALQGYGQGVESALSSANQSAVNEYGTEFGRRSTDAYNMYQSEANKTNAYNQYSADKEKTNYSTLAQEYFSSNSRNGTTFNMNYDKYGNTVSSNKQTRY